MTALVDDSTDKADSTPKYQRWFTLLSGYIFRKPLPWPQQHQRQSWLLDTINQLLALFWRKPLDIRKLRHYLYWGNCRLQYYFPHIDIHHLQPRDLIRLPIQILRLLIVQFPSYYAKEHHKPLQLASQMKFEQPQANLAQQSRRWLKQFAHLPAKHLKLIQDCFNWFENNPLWHNALVRYFFIGLALALTVLCITIPFSPFEQLLFLLSLWGVALWCRQIPGTTASLIMIVLSVLVSTRYVWWRTTSTLNWDDLIDLSLGLVLLSAELYAWLILMLGYFQTSWPLKRPPAVMPKALEQWPTVDIYIPTYNEPLDVVRPTVFAALGMDWPRDKINIVILDDGKREVFRQFAEQVGVGYLTRPDNKHAKAGNLNHALTKTNGEFVTIFDCDHIPTRSFLQIAMGWFLQDKKLALVQTPHHFFSPDPFERNLKKFRNVPNEGELFYGLIQDGNDLWNASFFCGSCAILRRAPLLEVGGIAVETVTEDAHTALKLHAKGYNSAYLNLPQAAGLATESLSAHIGQRIRWARGMAQIFRTDNPIFKKGLKFAQRVCYSNAMLHFLYGIPRLIFLTAPMAFLIAHSYTINAPAIAIALYVFPHIIHANLTNSRMQGAHRNSFWAEMYETVLAWYIMRPTTMALIDPSKGTFNVTAKGGLIAKEYFDWRISIPYLTLIGINLLGIGFGLWRLYTGPAHEMSTVLINLFWVLYNLIILGGAIAVATEVQQIRHDHRVEFRLPATLLQENGRMLACRMIDYSEGGMGLEVHDGTMVNTDEKVHVMLRRGTLEFAFPAKITHIRNTMVGLQFSDLTQQQQVDLVQCTFARADAWTSWSKKRATDAPISSLLDVLSMGLRGYVKLIEGLFNLSPDNRRVFHIFSKRFKDFLPTTPVVNAHPSKAFFRQ